MKLIHKVMEKTGVIKRPVVGQINLIDTDLIKLNDFGFHLAINGHLYSVKDNLKDIVDDSKPVELEYFGEIKLAIKHNPKYMKDFQSFKSFKEAYNCIKRDLEREVKE